MGKMYSLLNSTHHNHAIGTRKNQIDLMKSNPTVCTGGFGGVNTEK